MLSIEGSMDNEAGFYERIKRRLYVFWLRERMNWWLFIHRHDFHCVGRTEEIPKRYHLKERTNLTTVFFVLEQTPYAVCEWIFPSEFQDLTADEKSFVVNHFREETRQRYLTITIRDVRIKSISIIENRAY